MEYYKSIKNNKKIDDFKSINYISQAEQYQ